MSVTWKFAHLVGLAGFGTLLACSGANGSIESGLCTGTSCDASAADTSTTTEAGSAADAGIEGDGMAADASIPPPLDGSTDGTVDATDAASTADPCPSTSLAINCSSTCGTGTLGACALVSCKTDWTGEDPQLLHVSVPSVLRTPDLPGVDQSCEQACNSRGSSGPPMGTPHRAFGMAFMVDVPFNTIFQTRVGAPWWIESFTNAYATFCPPPVKLPDGIETQTCLAQRSSTMIFVWTDDPNAPARNIEIEMTDLNTACK